MAGQGHGSNLPVGGGEGGATLRFELRQEELKGRSPPDGRIFIPHIQTPQQQTASLTIVSRMAPFTENAETPSWP